MKSTRGIRPPYPFHDELDDLKRKYTPEQIKKLWDDATPKLPNIMIDKIITGTSENESKDMG